MTVNEDRFFEQLAKGGKFEDPEEGKENEGEEEEKENEVQLTRADFPMRSKKAKEEKMNEPEGQLTIDVYQTPNDIVIESAIAGVRPEDLDVEVAGDSVSIKGERYKENEVGDDDYIYQECYWGRFSRSVILPQEIDPENATVTFKNGILQVRLPKLNRKKSRKLKVKFE